MATLRNARAGVVVLGLLALAPVLVSTCSPGSPSSAGGVSTTLVGDDPVCYSENAIRNSTVPLPHPSQSRQYIYAQFKAVPSMPDRKDLEPDVRFMDSLGNRAFSVRIKRDHWDEGLKELLALDAVCLANFKNNNRASPLLFGDRSRLRGYDPNDGVNILITVYVRFYSDVPLAEQKAILTSVGVLEVDSLKSFNDEWLVTLPDVELPNLHGNGQVQWVENLDPDSIDDIDNARAAVGIPPDFANDGDGTVIAQWEVCHPANEIPDEHPDLANRADTGLGQKFCTPTSSMTTPSNRHATQVAGILAGDGSASAGAGGTANQWRGMAPKATIVSYSVHGSDTYGLIDEYLDAAQSMALISSNSWGSEFDDYYHRPHSTIYAFRSALFDTVASRRNAAGDPAGPGQRMLVVASSGNRGGDRVDPSDPSSDRIYWRTARIRNSAKNVLTVGNVASAPANSVGNPAFDSGRGPTKDGRLKPDLVAPGSQDLPPLGQQPGIISPVFPATAANVSDYYAPGWGTSFSTPIVAGAAATLAATILEGACNRNPTPAELRALLVHTAEDLVDASDEAEYPSLIEDYTSGEYELAKAESDYFDDVDPPNFRAEDEYTLTSPPNGVDVLVGPDFVFGYGMVQPARADSLAAAGNFVRAAVDQGYVEFPILVRKADLEDGVLRITLAWDDPPSSRSSYPDPETGLLQNDLDLVVVAPNGQRYFPWKLDPANPLLPAVQESLGRFAFWPKDTGDHRNTIEQVAIVPETSLLERTWRVQVWGTNMRLPPQEFALASEVIQPAEPCAGITLKPVKNPVMPPRDVRYWVLFVITVVVLLLLVLWLAELVYNAYLPKGHREAILRVIIILMVLLLIAIVLFRWWSAQALDPV